ncbi:MAG: hypothetical protein IJT94_09640 [Oscillibacter sp.]|nr:hypothetical protein [Oscillibacter sp.]
MTLERLNQHARLRLDLERAENLKASLEEAIDLKAQVLTGMPHAPGCQNKLGNLIPVVMDGVAAASAEIERLKGDIARDEPQILDFIDSIPDAQTRTIFRLRFLGSLPWNVIPLIVKGNTEDSVKAICYRYLKSCHAVSRADA